MNWFMILVFTKLGNPVHYKEVSFNYWNDCNKVVQAVKDNLKHPEATEYFVACVPHERLVKKHPKLKKRYSKLMEYRASMRK